MSYAEMRGALSIKDPRGLYIGLQHVARSYLFRQNIDISFLGSAEKPTAVVLKLTAHPTSKEAEERAIRDPRVTSSEAEIRERFQKRRMLAMHMKADYFANATPERFATLLSQATSNLNVDRLADRYGTFHIYYNNSLTVSCSEEEFYSGTVDFTYK